MNTKIQVWLEPLTKSHQRSYSKVFFDVVVKGDLTDKTHKEAEDFINVKELMDFADIELNWNFGVCSLSKTSKKPYIAFVREEQLKSTKREKSQSAKQGQKKENKNEIAIRDIISRGTLSLRKDDVYINDDGTLSIIQNGLQIQQIDFPSIWSSIEKNIVGKIKEGDFLELKDDNGNVLMELHGGGFLNIGLADLSVYESKEMAEKMSIFTQNKGLKGGLFVRKDGSLDIGDIKRTFYIKVYTGKLLLASLKAKKSIGEFLKTNLLNK